MMGQTVYSLLINKHKIFKYHTVQILNLLTIIFFFFNLFIAYICFFFVLKLSFSQEINLLRIFVIMKTKKKNPYEFKT